MTDSNKKKSLLWKLQNFLASYKGKVILNYAYSWGAAVVILGTLFKLVHLPGANMMLFIGMGTEVLVFFISAFDRPYKSYKWESVFPNLKISGSGYDKKEEMTTTVQTEDTVASAMLGQGQAQGQVFAGGSPIIVGGGGYIGGTAATSSLSANEAASSHSNMGNIPAGGIQGGGGIISLGNGGGSMTPGVEVSPEMEEATKAYMEQLQEMTEALGRFVEQTKYMGQDAEQINILSKNLTGINAVYEIQLRNISTQLGTIDEINDQTKKMARQIDELNGVYARMLEAMTVNMKIKE